MRRAVMCQAMVAMLCGLLLPACGDDEPIIVPASCAGEAAVTTSGPAELAGDYCGVANVPIRWTLRADRSFTRVMSYPLCPEDVICFLPGGDQTSEGTYREEGGLLRLTFTIGPPTPPDQLQAVRCDEREGISLVADGKVFAPSSCP